MRFTGSTCAQVYAHSIIIPSSVSTRDMPAANRHGKT